MAAKKPTAIYIRNTRNITVHVRLSSLNSDKPYRIVLKPRGLQGDCERIPAALQDSPEYGSSLKYGLFEVIPESEYNAIEYQPVTYSGRKHVEEEDWMKPIVVVKNEEKVVSTMSLDNETKRQGRVEVHHTAPKYVNAPGADATQAREISRPDASPETFQARATHNPAHQDTPFVSQGEPKTRKPANRNPTPQKPQQ